MAWWAWLLVGWAVVAIVCAVWWGLALANAEVQDAARRLTDEADADAGAGRGASSAGVPEPGVIDLPYRGLQA